MDVDGTLLNSKGRLLPGTMEALRHCVRKGILLYLATARPRRLIFREEEVHGEVDFLKTRGVFYNGAIAVDDSIGAYTHWPIAGDTVSATVGFLETFASDIQTVHFRFYVSMRPGHIVPAIAVCTASKKHPNDLT